MSFHRQFLRLCYTNNWIEEIEKFQEFHDQPVPPLENRICLNWRVEGNLIVFSFNGCQELKIESWIFNEKKTIENHDFPSVQSLITLKEDTRLLLHNYGYSKVLKRPNKITNVNKLPFLFKISTNKYWMFT